MVTDELARENIAANVTALLKKRGMTRSQLSDSTGENAMYLSRICNGKILPNAAALARIAEALGVTSERLMENPQ